MAKNKDKTREEYERWLAEIQAEEDRPPACIFIGALIVIATLAAFVIYEIFRFIIEAVLFFIV